MEPLDAPFLQEGVGDGIGSGLEIGKVMLLPLLKKMSFSQNCSCALIQSLRTGQLQMSSVSDFHFQFVLAFAVRCSTAC